MVAISGENVDRIYGVFRRNGRTGNMRKYQRQSEDDDYDDDEYCNDFLIFSRR